MRVEEIRVDLEEDLVEVLARRHVPGRLRDPQVLDEMRLPAAVELGDPFLERRRAGTGVRPRRRRRSSRPGRSGGRGDRGRRPRGPARPGCRARPRTSARRRLRRRSPRRHRSSRAGAPPSTGSARTGRSCSCRCGRRAPRSRAGRGPGPWPAGRPPRGCAGGCVRRRSGSDGRSGSRGSRSTSSSVHLFEDARPFEDSTTGRTVNP